MKIPKAVVTTDWLIVYRDRSEFSSDDGEVWDAPRFGVMAVFQRDALVGWREDPSNQGFWIWKDGEWFGTDTPGFWDYLYHHTAPTSVVLFGTVIPDTEWKTSMRPYLTERFGVLKGASHARESS